MSHCPLSKWTPLSSIDQGPLLFHFFVTRCHFSSRNFSAHLHHTEDGYRAYWWDYKSVAAPDDYHHGDQPSTYSSTLKIPNVLIGNDAHLLRHAQWVSSSSSLPFVSMCGRLCVSVCELWVTSAVMESLPWCEVLGPFEVPSAVKMSAMI